MNCYTNWIPGRVWVLVLGAHGLNQIRTRPVAMRSLEKPRPLRTSCLYLNDIENKRSFVVVALLGSVNVALFVCIL
jgi:hypothetical protein